MFRRALCTVVLTSVVLTCLAAPAIARDARRAPAVRAAGPETTLTFTPRVTIVRYGSAVVVSGSLTSAGVPVAGAAVTLRETRGGVTRDGGAAVTNSQGVYQTTVSPRFNGSWHAEAAGVSSLAVVIQVRPRVTLALAHTQSGTRLTEIFSGAVAPSHTGRRVLVQRSTAGGWRTVESGRLDARSRYRIRWLMPYRSAVHKLRVLLPAHGDHADGVSPTAYVRVRVDR
jgi:hypothetical protein